MKKLFFMIGAAIGAIVPFGRANADCSYSYEYTGASGQNITSNNKPENISYIRYQTCDGNITEEKNYDSDGNVTKKTVYDYRGNQLMYKSEYDYITDTERTKTTYSCNDNGCELFSTTEQVLPKYLTFWTNYYPFSEKIYQCDNGICSVSGVYDHKNNSYYSCSNGTCYAYEYRDGSSGYFYDNDKNLTGGYDGDYNTFSCSGTGNNIKCTFDKDGSEFEVPEGLKTAPTHQLLEKPYCGSTYFGNNYNCSKCPSGSETCYMNDNGQLVTDCKSGYKEQGGGCVTSCDSSYRDMGEWCNKIRWTPAEAAEVLRDDNTNEVTITFKK